MYHIDSNSGLKMDEWLLHPASANPLTVWKYYCNNIHFYIIMVLSNIQLIIHSEEHIWNTTVLRKGSLNSSDRADPLPVSISLSHYEMLATGLVFYLQTKHVLLMCFLVQTTVEHDKSLVPRVQPEDLAEAKASHLTRFVCAGIWDTSVEVFVFVWALEELQTGDKGSLLQRWNRCTAEESHFLPLSTVLLESKPQRLNLQSKTERKVRRYRLNYWLWIFPLEIIDWFWLVLDKVFSILHSWSKQGSGFVLNISSSSQNCQDAVVFAL